MKQMRNLILAAVALTAAVIAPVASASAATLQEIVDRGTLKIGYITSPPSTVKDPVSGELSGFYVDAAREIALQMGVKAEFVETTWGNFVAGLQSGQFDLSIAGTFATVKRSMAIDFTRPVAYIGYGTLVRANDDRFKSFADINKPDVRVAVVQGGSAEEYARRNLPDAEIVTLASGNLTAPFIEVASNRADVAIEDAFTMNRFIKEQPSVRNIFRDHPYNLTPIAWATAKGNGDLLKVVDTGLSILISSGQFDAMARAYGDVGTRFIAIPYLTGFPRQN